MADRIQIVQGDRLCQFLDRETMTARVLIKDSEQVQGKLMRRLARQNSLANDLGLFGSTVLVGELRLGHQVGNAGPSGIANSLVTRNSGTALSAIHLAPGASFNRKKIYAEFMKRSMQFTRGRNLRIYDAASIFKNLAMVFIAARSRF